MIKTWSVEHFKSVYESTQLEMEPLTIFTGANSSGKSTIIQSLLLTTQTIQNNIQSKSVILNGHIIKLGTFKDILSNNQENENISIGFELDLDLSEVKNTSLFVRNRIFGKVYEKALINCEFSFFSNDSGNIKGNTYANEISQLHPELDSCTIQIHTENHEKKENEEIIIRKSRKEVSKRKEELRLQSCEVNEEKSLEYEVELNKNAQQNLLQHPYIIQGNPVGAKLLHFLPERLTIIFDRIKEESKQILEAYIELNNIYKQAPLEKFSIKVNDVFEKEVLEIISLVNEELKKEERDYLYSRSVDKFHKLGEEFSWENVTKYYKSIPSRYQNLYQSNMKQRESQLLNALRHGIAPKYELAQTFLPLQLESAIENIKEFFSKNVKYLGPLRDEPKPIYPHSGTTDSKDVGFKGEHTAAVLEIHKRTFVDYISPEDLEKGLNQNIKRGPLLNAVLEWLEYMGVVKNVQTVDRGKLGHELKVIVEGGNSFHDLTNVGVGVSQVLPILVLSLLADKGATLIFEQPELHLHPRVQTRLADFYVSMIYLKKQCIVESHSEYLINRLRYRSAISDNEDVSKNVIMYFVEKEAGKSKYNAVKMNKFGVIEEWPKGFFDENEEISANILRAAMQKRKKERRG